MNYITKRYRASTAYNGRFGAMAAFPRVDRFCYFRTLLARVDNVFEAATAAICWALQAMQDRVSTKSRKLTSDCIRKKSIFAH